MATRGKRGNYQFLKHVSPTNGVYSLIVRQQPVKSKVSPVADKTGAGEKKTIDPAVIVELKITDDAEKPASSDPVHYLYNPFLFAYATLLDPDTLEEIPYMDDSMHILTGSIASCVYHLKDPENDNNFGAFFVFPDIAIRQEGKYRLKISLFKITGNDEDPTTANSKVVLLQSVNTDVFQVYPIKDQGLKLRLRKSAKGDSKKDDDDSSENESPRVTSATSSGHPDLNYNRKRAAEASAPPSRGRPPPDPYAPHPYYYRPPPMGYPPYPPPPGAYGAPPPGYPPYYYPPPPHDQHHPGYPPAPGYPPSHERPPYPSSHERPPYPGHHERPPYPGHYDSGYHPHYPPPQYPPQRSAPAGQGSSSGSAPSPRPPYLYPHALAHPAGAPGHPTAPSPTQASGPGGPPKPAEDHMTTNGKSSPIAGDVGTTRQSPAHHDLPPVQQHTSASSKLPGPEELLKKEEEVLRRLTSASADAPWEHAPKRTRLDADDQAGPATAPSSATSDKPPAAVTSATSAHSLPPPQLPSDRPRRLSIPGRDYGYHHPPGPPGGPPPHHYPLPPPGQQQPAYYYPYPPPPPGSYSGRPRPPPAGYDARNPYPHPPPHFQPYYLPPPPGARGGYSHPPPPHSGPQSAPAGPSGPPPLANPAPPSQAHHDHSQHGHAPPPAKE